MLKEDWLERCIDQFIKRGVSEIDAIEAAHACWINDDPLDGFSPEAVADMEMSTWGGL